MLARLENDMAFIPFSGNAFCDLYPSDPLHLAQVPSGPAYDTNVPCRSRKPRLSEVAPLFPLTVIPVSLMIELPAGTMVFDAYTPSGSPAGYAPTMIELPVASGNYYIVQWSEIAARGYINEHLLCWCHKRVATAITE